MPYVSPLSIMIGNPQEILYHPLSAIDNSPVQINNTEHQIWDVLSVHVDRQIKLPEQLRDVVMRLSNPLVSIHNRIELPFTTSNNNIAVEILQGSNRFLFFQDTNTRDTFRLKTIPYDHTDPELYMGK